MKRLQNKIAQSRRALPVTAVYSLIVCLAGGLVSEGLWLQFAMLLASAVMMAELNNSNALIRIYSRMVSCSFLVMTAMSLMLFRSLEVAIAQITFIGFLLFLLRAYQDQQATGLSLYAFICIGLCSVFFPQVLLLLPVLWIIMAVNVICFSPRTFFASLLGVLMPYWFVAAWLLYTNDMGWLAAHFASILQFEKPLQLGIINIHQWITFAFVLAVSVLGSIHFIVYSYQDRIRIRLIYEMFMALASLLLAFALLQPQHFDNLLGMAIVVTAPLSGHFIALTHSRASNVTFFVLAATALGITVFNIWMS